MADLLPVLTHDFVEGAYWGALVAALVLSLVAWILSD